MPKDEKLFSRIQGNPRNVRFSDVCRLAELFGFRCRGGKGSHRIYTRPDVTELVDFQNVTGMAKPYQVKQLLKIVEERKLKLKED